MRSKGLRFNHARDWVKENRPEIKTIGRKVEPEVGWVSREYQLNGRCNCFEGKKGIPDESLIVMYCKDPEKYDEALTCSYMHEMGHHIHRFSYKMSWSQYYREFNQMQQEFGAWECGREVLPKKLRPSVKVYNRLRDTCLDIYLENGNNKKWLQEFMKQ